jgi:SAM-dependent methyltransferase
MERINIIREGRIDLAALQTISARPPVFEPGEEHFWDDPYISQQMLKAHLDPTTDAASRRPEIIDRIVAWIIRQTGLQAGASILDLGCGPGLYTSRLARCGFRVTGVDFSQNSLDYARTQAQAEGLSINYIYQDYRSLDISAQFDLAMLIYFDLGVLSPADLDRVLAKTAQALKPGGFFIFDVVTSLSRPDTPREPTWSVKSSGFWRPGPHMVVHQQFDYPENHAYLDQYIVIDDSGNTAVYRIWEQHYNPDTIRIPLERAGLGIEILYSDLVGTPFSPTSLSLGIVARKGHL